MIKHQLILIRLKEGLAIILSCNMILQSQAFRNFDCKANENVNDKNNQTYLKTFD